MDNIFIERLWRTVKVENICLKEYATVPELESGLAACFRFHFFPCLAGVDETGRRCVSGKR